MAYNHTSTGGNCRRLSEWNVIVWFLNTPKDYSVTLIPLWGNLKVRHLITKVRFQSNITITNHMGI